ncbi:MAG: YHS domain-containing protein [Burkholderiales bacterium]|nr:YHS domain-containing protein [Burkholderiales bacterium]
MTDSMIQTCSRFVKLALGAAAALIGSAALAAAPINTLEGGLFGGRGDVAILGYDSVAYFTDGKAVKGQDTFVLEWMGAKWKFASKAHLEQFKASPQQYAPQYGGYCAYGVSQGNLVKVEPEQFTLIDGKLYLNYDASVQATWLKDSAGYIRSADAKFLPLLKK